MIKRELHIFRGMLRDFSVSKQPQEFMIDALNIRLTPREDDTLLSITNEKGNKSIATFNGVYLGHTTIDKYLVVFSTNPSSSSKKDYIAIFTFRTDSFGVEHESHINSNLNFSVDYPIEALGIKENEDIVKVYWVDGLNQPRVISLFRNYPISTEDIDTTFDFLPTLNNNHIINIELKIDSSGSFPSGTILYAFSYFNRNGSESNIFYVSELLYSSRLDSGGSPDEKMACSFDISFQDLDYKFDYIRVYSIVRTSLNATPTVKLVTELDTKSSTYSTIIINDNNTLGEVIDPKRLLFIGGEPFIATTLALKDLTLFLGNITLSKMLVSKKLLYLLLRGITISKYYRLVNLGKSKEFYPNINTLSKGYTAGFKLGEHYRIGVQLQHKTGVWSEPIFIKDFNMGFDYPPKIEEGILYIPSIRLNIPYAVPFNEMSHIVQVALINEDYIGMRALVVYPELKDRKVIAQGILNPTIINLGNRYKKSPTHQASWFFRPEDNGIAIPGKPYTQVEFRHYYALHSGGYESAEVLSTASMTGRHNNLDNFNMNFSKYFDLFLVDLNTVTFNSPDLEFTDDLQSISFTPDIKFRIIGYAPIESNNSDISILTSTPTINPTSSGFYHFPDSNIRNNKASGIVSGLYYKDYFVDDNNGNYEPYNKLHSDVGYLVYAWHRSGSLNNDINRPLNKGTRTAVLKNKRIANFKYFSNTKYLNSNYHWTNSSGITLPKIFSSNEVSVLSLLSPNSEEEGLLYAGNIDMLVSPDSYYHIYSTTTNTALFDFFSSPKPISVGDIGDDNLSLLRSKESTRIKYKSSPHIVFSLKDRGSSQVILPRLSSTLNYSQIKSKPFWLGNRTPLLDTKTITMFGEDIIILNDKHNAPNVFPPPQNDWKGGELIYSYKTVGDNKQVGKLYSYIKNGNPYFPYTEEELTIGELYVYNYTTYIVYQPISSSSYSRGLRTYEYNPISLHPYSITRDTINIVSTSPYLLIGEFYRDNISNAFGGTDERSFKDNKWLPASNTKYYGVNTSSLTLDCTLGDTWYARYDCIKTYPFTEEDLNSIVEVGSFMCETRANLNGIYTKDKGFKNPLYINPLSYNKFNPVYNQKNNYFIYRGIDYDNYKVNKFPNQIVWSREKINNEKIDTWTNINLANSLDLNGESGNITKLITYNNELFCFQDRGLSNIIFNPRVLIPTSDGVPIELSNSYKVLGKRYISEIIGCSNKFTIDKTPRGIYFIDSNNPTIYLYNGLINDISTNEGFSTWVRDNIKGKNIWSPNIFSGIKTMYDHLYNDVYFVTSNIALCFSEKINKFTSFYSYGGMLGLSNYFGDTYSLYGSNIFKLFAGKYNVIFNKYVGYNLTFVSNSEPTVDKIFNNLNFRGDRFREKELTTLSLFHYIRVWNEYQDTGEVLLNYNRIKPSNLKLKFRIWGLLIPRDLTGKNNRIRNTWAKIKLGAYSDAESTALNINPNEKLANDNIELHDMLVDYYAN